ncbi:hypothetical protein MT997_01950 [Paenibacillus sp. OVF10]|nr:hypothetical protein MT997_01950 [Paenibacillus sp. OVF10]
MRFKGAGRKSVIAAILAISLAGCSGGTGRELMRGAPHPVRSQPSIIPGQGR